MEEIKGSKLRDPKISECKVTSTGSSPQVSLQLDHRSPRKASLGKLFEPFILAWVCAISKYTSPFIAAFTPVQSQPFLLCDDQVLISHTLPSAEYWG